MRLGGCLVNETLVLGLGINQKQKRGLMGREKERKKGAVYGRGL